MLAQNEECIELKGPAQVLSAQFDFMVYACVHALAARKFSISLKVTYSKNIMQLPKLQETSISRAHLCDKRKG